MANFYHCNFFVHPAIVLIFFFQPLSYITSALLIKNKAYTTLYTVVYAFIYESGIVIIENFKENDKTLPTIVMPIDKFLELSNLKNVLLVDFVKSADVGIKRIFHTSINNWQRNLFDEINGTYELEDAINFINEI